MRPFLLWIQKAKKYFYKIYIYFLSRQLGHIPRQKNCIISQIKLKLQYKYKLGKKKQTKKTNALFTILQF